MWDIALLPLFMLVMGAYGLITIPLSKRIAMAEAKTISLSGAVGLSDQNHP